MRSILTQEKYISWLKSPYIIPTQKLSASLHNDGQLPLWMLVQLVVKMSAPIFLVTHKFATGLRDLKGNDFFHKGSFGIELHQKLFN